MRRTKWTTASSVYVPEIDAEHRALYRCVEALQKAMLAEAPVEHVLPIVEEAATEIAGHFAHEERLMKTTRYPSIAWHKRQHDGATHRVVELYQRIRAGDASATPALLDYLTAWMQDHILVADRMLAAHLRGWDRVHTPLAS